MNFANMQKAAQSRYSVSSIPQLTEVCSDSSSSDDEDNKNKMNKMKKQRVTKSVTEGQEKVLVALLKKHGPRVSVGWRGRVEDGLGGRR